MRERGDRETGATTIHVALLIFASMVASVSGVAISFSFISSVMQWLVLVQEPQMLVTLELFPQVLLPQLFHSLPWLLLFVVQP